MGGEFVAWVYLLGFRSSVLSALTRRTEEQHLREVSNVSQHGLIATVAVAHRFGERKQNAWTPLFGAGILLVLMLSFRSSGQEPGAKKKYDRKHDNPAEAIAYARKVQMNGQ